MRYASFTPQPSAILGFGNKKDTFFSPPDHYRRTSVEMEPVAQIVPALRLNYFSLQVERPSAILGFGNKKDTFFSPPDHYRRTSLEMEPVAQIRASATTQLFLSRETCVVYFQPSVIGFVKKKDIFFSLQIITDGQVNRS
jgi:hypothetical protein